MTQAKPRFSTFEEYLSYDDGTDKLYELFNGELIELPPESGENSGILSFVHFQLVLLMGHLRVRWGLELEESLPYISITSEAARREFLIAPVLVDLVHYTHCKIAPEYPLVVSDQLMGSLDTSHLLPKSSTEVFSGTRRDCQRAAVLRYA
jgi:hypothetical protein